MKKSLVDISPALVAHLEAAEAVEPRTGTLDDPAVTTQALAAMDASTSDSWRDGALAQLMTATPAVIGFVGVQLLGTLARSTSCTLDRFDSVHKLSQHLRLVAIRTSQQGR